MSGWQTSRAQWAAWVSDDPRGASQSTTTAATPVDDIDAKVVAHLHRRPFPVNGDVTLAVTPGDHPEMRSETLPAMPPDRLGDDDEPTLLRMDRESLDISLTTPSGEIEVGLADGEDAATVVVNLPPAAEVEAAMAREQAAAEAAVAEEDDGLFIPTLTRPADPVPPEPPVESPPAVTGGTVVAPAPTAPEPPPAQAPREASGAPELASTSSTSGVITMPEDEAAQTLINGRIDEEPVVPPPSKVVIDPSASAVLDQVYDTDEDEADDDIEPQELDADDLVEEEPEPIEEQAPPPAPPASRETVDVGPPPPPTPAAHLAAATVALPAAPRVDPNWQIEFFGEQHAALLPVDRATAAQAEADFVVHCLGLGPGATLADIGCGDGAHAVAFARRGLNVTAVDGSPVQLQRASQAAQASNVAVNLVSGDIRQPAPDTGYDAVVCLGGTLGMFDDQEDRALMQHMRDRLRPGGRLMLQVLNRDYIVARLPARSWWQGQGCLVLDEAQNYAPTSRVHVHRTLVFETGAQFEHYIALRVYSLTELVHMCAQVGLRVLEYSGSRHTRRCFYDATSAEIWLIAERPEGT